MTIPAAQPHPAPGRPVLRPSGPRSLSVVWPQPASTAGITGYELELELDGDALGWSAIPGSGASTRSFVIPPGVGGNLFNVAAAQQPGSLGDSGLRAQYTADAVVFRTVRRRVNAPSTLRLTGQENRGIARVELRSGNIRIDFTDTAPGGRPSADLTDAAEQNWAWAIQVLGSRQVWGAFRLRDDILRVGGATAPARPQDPYVTAWPPGQDFDVFDAARLLAPSCKVIVFDTRPGDVTGVDADFTYDTSLRVGSRYRARIRTTGAAGTGAASPWSNTAIPGAASTGRLTAGLERAQVQQAEIPPSVINRDQRTLTVFPGDTTSYTVSVPTSAGVLSETVQVSVVAPAGAPRVLDAVRADLGSCSAAGAFTPDASFGPAEELNEGYIVNSLRWETHAHTEAGASVVVRAADFAAAQRYRTAPFLQIAVQAGRNEDVVFLGRVDPTKGSITEEGENRTWLVELEASTMWRTASRAKLVGQPFSDDQPEPVFAEGVRRLVGSVGDVLYRRTALPTDHLRLGVRETGPSLFADSRDWPPHPVLVQSAVRRPLTVADAARAVGDHPARGWQMAPDGFLRPLLHQHFPAEAIDPLDGIWDIRIRGVAAVAPANRQFGEIPLPADAERPLPVNARHYRIPDGDGINADDYVPAAGDFDHRPGQVIVEREWVGEYEGDDVKYIRLLVLDPGGYGSRYPLPALVEPELVRVGVVRTDDRGNVNEQDEDLAGGERSWVLTPTHLERTGAVNDAVLTAALDGNPWVAAGAGAAQRSEQSGWRYAVRVDLIDRVPAPVAVSWKSFTPEWIGRTVDIRGYPGAAGGLKVVRLAARVHSITEDGVTVEWTVTALQSAALEESMDGTEFLRELRRGVEEGE